MEPQAIIPRFDAFLHARQLQFERVILGGAALVLLEVITRETQDCDVLEPSLPEDIAAASREFAAEQRSLGHEVKDNWFNNEPSSLVSELAEGWRERLIVVHDGKALKLRALGRLDLIKTKLFALCDRMRDEPDCLALAPTASELQEAEPWVADRDANPQWSEHVHNELARLGEKLGHGN